MSTPAKLTNPFVVQTPEGISAEAAHSLFVDVFTDFPKVKHIGHTFLNGHRGSGKSMMFRYLQPDCQQLDLEASLHELTFFGVYVPIKNTELKITELIRIKDQSANVLINEHFMTMYAAAKVFASMADLAIEEHYGSHLDTTVAYVKNVFAHLFELCGWKGTIPDTFHSVTHCLIWMRDTCDDSYRAVINYLKKLSFPDAIPPVYNGPLCGYLDFLHPMLRQLKDLPFMPDGPIYLLLDDADNLNHTQTMILNSWVSTRTSQDVSLKISTQLKYKTYKTVTGQIISSPHDYSEVSISSIYTSSKDKYRERVRDILKKRLKLADIDDVTPEEFFPPDAAQEEQIEAIRKDLRDKWETAGRGARPSDDVVRYARPIFMERLRGPSKSGPSYSYSGFEQLVHLSSGLIRFFLEPASLMYSNEQARNPDKRITSISPRVQHDVVRSQAVDLMFSEFDKLRQEESQEPSYQERVEKLSNLIMFFGGLFQAILLSDRSERRVFSIAFTDGPDREVQDVLNLGVEYGYFHESSIGNKEGTGRTRLYVLTRRLAPFFYLDPNGFAGYRFITNARAKAAMYAPKRVLREAVEKGIDRFLESEQPSLFDNE